MEIRLISACAWLTFLWLAQVLGQISSACSSTILSRTIALANDPTPTHRVSYCQTKITSPPWAEVYQVSSKRMCNFVVFHNRRVQFSSRILRHLDKATDGNFTSKVRLAFLIDISVQCVDLGFQNVIWQSNIRPSLSFNTMKMLHGTHAVLPCVDWIFM